LGELWNYHGLDILGFVLSFASIHLLARKHRGGFLAGAVASVAWSVVSVLAQSTPMLVANIVFGLMHLNGFRRWAAAPEIPPARDSL
jgi:hypothetical protein